MLLITLSQIAELNKRAHLITLISNQILPVTTMVDSYRFSITKSKHDKEITV